jgi:hypothetical protein
MVHGSMNYELSGGQKNPPTPERKDGGLPVAFCERLLPIDFAY